MRMSLTGAVRSREATQKLRMFSKQWEPGSTLRVFYRTYLDEESGTRQLLAGGCWGHKVNDMTKLGIKSTFIPSLCDYNEEGSPVGKPDILFRFSRLAPLFIAGEKQKKIDEVQSKDYPNETLRRESLLQIEQEYDAKSNLKAIKPVISRPTMLITVEALVVPYKDGKPNFDTPVVVCQPISNKVAKQLDAILNNPRFAPIDEDGFLEVEWVFPMDTNKGQSGLAAAPAGLSVEYTMKTQFPEDYTKVKAQFGSVAADSDMVRRRATSGVEESTIMQAITNYSFRYSDGLGYCENDKDLFENVMKNVELIKELDVARAIKSPVFTERYNRELQLRVDEDLPAPEEAVPEQQEAAKATPTIEGLLQTQQSTTTDDTSLDGVMDDIDLNSFTVGN